MRLRRSPRRTRMPTVLATQVDERRLAEAPVSQDGSCWAVATAYHLVIVSLDSQPHHLPWDQVEHGSWNAEERVFRLRRTGGQEEVVLQVPGGLRQEGRYVPVDVTAFARALRQRVEAALVHSAVTTLPSGQAASASVRRDPNGILYSVTSPPHHQVAGTEDEEALRELERQTRSTVGLPIR
ncbi:hypothetical protein [Actinomyces sp. 2119]|uniref:hypothetical protein n=1 Tax=Actinomyces sp. 2119 TaxID=2321393 RepID=UPI002175989C|nr:hypothetical protein [Actinomyces sp. 2119]